MNIQKRINARKIILSYIYQYNFFCKLQESELIAVESLFIDNIYKTDKQKFEIAKKKYFEDIKKYFNLFTKEEDLLDFVNLFFNERNEKDIDFDYVIKIGKTFLKYIEEVKQKVNALTLSFNFDEMDTIDQSLFIL